MNLREKPWHLFAVLNCFALVILGIASLDIKYLYVINFILVLALAVFGPQFFRVNNRNIFRTIIAGAGFASAGVIISQQNVHMFKWFPVVSAFSFIAIFGYYIFSGQRQVHKLANLFALFAICILAILASGWSSITFFHTDTKVIFSLVALTITSFTISLILAKSYIHTLAISTILNIIFIILTSLIISYQPLNLWIALFIALSINMFLCFTWYLLQIAQTNFTAVMQFGFAAIIFSVLGTLTYMFEKFFI